MARPKKKRPKKLKGKRSGKKRSRKKKPTRKIFEKRPRKPAPEPPEGFTINLGATTQDEAYATIKARLDDTKARLPEGYEARIIIHPYADGSVDGELYVKVPEAAVSGNVAFDLSDALSNSAIGVRYWISMGARYTIEADDEIYRRFRGMNQVQTNYQRAISTNVAEEDVILRHTMLPGMEEHYKREAHSVFVRIHWNPQDERPTR